MPPTLEYSWATPEDLPEVVSFQIATFGQDSIQAYLGRSQWLYFDNPLGLHITVCRADGELIATCGHIPRLVHLGGEKILAGFGIDFMVAKPWRRQGIGRRFLEMRLDRFPLGLSLGQSRDMSSLYRSLGAMNLGPLFLGVHRKMPSISGGLKTLVRNNYIWFKGLRALGMDKRFAGRIVNNSTAGHPFSESDWINWRYNSQTYGDYYCWNFESGEARAMVVFRNFRQGKSIIDVFCEEKDRPSVLAASARLDKEAETRILFAGNRLKSDCAKAGFWLRPYGASVIAMTANDSLRKLLRPGALDLTAGSADADLLRIPSRT